MECCPPPRPKLARFGQLNSRWIRPGLNNPRWPAKIKTHDFKSFMNEFRAGVTAVLRTWSAFRTAVESNWGGDDSLRKAEDLRRNILEHMDGSSVPPKSMADVMDLEDALIIYMEEEFCLQLEDNSEKEIARILWNMYEDCSKGDFQLALQMVESAEQVVAQVKAYPVQVQASEEDDEDDDDDEVMGESDTNEGCVGATRTHMDDGATGSTATETVPRSAVDIIVYGTLPLFGPVVKRPAASTPPPRQLGETAPTEPSAPVDDDGFAPVARKRKPTRK